MKKRIVVSLIIAIMLLMGSFSSIAQTQSPVSQLKPTFLAPTPGIYVNGWPAFTVSYPKDWMEQPPRLGEVFRVAAPDAKAFPRVPNFAILIVGGPFSIDKWSNILVPGLRATGRDVKILYDKPSQLKDGTPAQEAEVEWIRNDELKLNMLVLTTRKDSALVMITQGSDKGKIEEDLKNYAYSLTFLRGTEEPVRVSPDIQEFLDKYSSDLVSGNVERIMTNFSDQFLHQSVKKAFFEQWFRNNPASPVQRGLISSEATVTIFEAHGDKAYVDGFFASKAREHPDMAVKVPMNFRQIIKEKGQWKWYGDQK